MQDSLYHKHLLNSYAPLPVNIVYGKGAWLFDHEDRAYLDLNSGMGVTILGHADPEIIKTIQTQSNKVLHLSNLIRIEQQAVLATKLAEICKIALLPKESPVKVFFSNSGAETVETAIKLTRLYANSKNVVDPQIVVMSNAYHGRTMAALSASDNPKFKQGFAPLLDGFIRISFNNYDELIALNHHKQFNNIVAILLEPIQGEGGINLPDPNYLSAIREICTKNNWLMILDEIQTGLARTGKMFCYQHYNIVPDLLLIAKGLANGIPIGACIIKQPYADLFKPTSHGSTFGGNPLACSVAITNLDLINQAKLWEKAEVLGKYFLQKLTQALKHNHKIQQIRGKGLMIGIELSGSWPDLMLTGLKHGIIFNITRNHIIRLLPPLIINYEEIDLAVELLVKTLA